MSHNHTCFIERIATDKKKTSMEYAISLKNVLEIYQTHPDMIEGGIISSVVPLLTDVLKQATEKLIRHPVKVVGPGLKTGLRIQTDNPAQLGSDQVVDAVAAIAEYPTPLIIVDMGTATTISVVDKHAAFIGCVIMPGVRIATDSLVNSTAQLTQISLTPPKKLIGSNTIDSMKSGAMYGHAASIDGLIDRIEEELGQKCSIVATGGLSGMVVSLCKHKMTIEEDLMLKGLQIIYNKNP